MADSITDKTIAEIVKLGRLGMGAQTVKDGNIPYVLVPEGCSAKAMPELIYNEHAEFPERVKANVSLLDPESFIAYYSLFHDENSRVFADEPSMKVVGIFDYHMSGDGQARWCQHRATLVLRESEEWKIWLGGNNKQYTQEQFAEFLEQHSIDITHPTPAAMMEVAKDLQMTTDVEFGAGIRMNDGQVRFKYTETTKATVGAGALAVPEQFKIDIPVFIGGQRISMQALLRFRVKDGHLVLWYTLIRPEEVKRTAFIASRAQIATGLGIGIINGTPAA